MSSAIPDGCMSMLRTGQIYTLRILDLNWEWYLYQGVKYALYQYIGKYMQMFCNDPLKYQTFGMMILNGGRIFYRFTMIFFFFNLLK